MVADEPDVIPSARYTARETAQYLGVSPSTVRRWTRIGLMRCNYRRINRRPVWTGEEIIRAWKSII